MDNTIRELVSATLKKTGLNECAQQELLQLTREHPYFAPGHLLLARKMMDEANGKDEQVPTTLHLFFPNPIWLDFLLHERGNATIDKKEIKPAFEPAFIAEETVAIAGTAPSRETGSAELQDEKGPGPEQERLAKTEETPYIENKHTPVQETVSENHENPGQGPGQPDGHDIMDEQEEMIAAGMQAESEATIQTENIPPATEWNEEKASPGFPEQDPGQLEMNTPSMEPEVTPEPQSEEKTMTMEPGAEATAPPSPEIMMDQPEIRVSETEPENETGLQPGDTNTVPPEDELPEPGPKMDVENTGTSRVTAQEIEAMVEKTYLSDPFMGGMEEFARDKDPGPVPENRSQEGHAGSDEAHPIAEGIPATGMEDSTGLEKASRGPDEGDPAPAIAPLRIEPIDPALAPLPLEPFYTVDYFASQGIKFREEQRPMDRLDLQLKSFTEWLKLLKGNSPPTEAKAVSDLKVDALAAHSLARPDVVTEAMAEVWEKQGNTGNAIEIYQKLSLLNPSKSSYFAAKIEILKQS